MQVAAAVVATDDLASAGRELVVTVLYEPAQILKLPELPIGAAVAVLTDVAPAADQGDPELWLLDISSK
jgi:hypothetical protein